MYSLELRYVSFNSSLSFKTNSKEFTLSETEKGKKSLIHDGYTYRIDRILKSSEISWRCTVKTCKGRLRTDDSCTTIISGTSIHSHDIESKKVEFQAIRASVKRKAFDDISTRPMKIVRSELQCVDDEDLEEKDLKNLTMAIYRKDVQSFQLYPNLERMFTMFLTSWS